MEFRDQYVKMYIGLSNDVLAFFRNNFCLLAWAQHTATHYNTPQHNTLQQYLRVTVHIGLSNHVLAVFRNTTHCNTLQHIATHCNTLQHNTLQQYLRVTVHIGLSNDVLAVFKFPVCPCSVVLMWRLTPVKYKHTCTRARVHTHTHTNTHM